MISEKTKNLLRHLIPGIYLPLLAGIWMLPVFIFQLCHLSDSSIDDLKDFLFYSPIPAVALLLPATLLGITLGAFEMKFHSWGKFGPWRQFAILIGSYALCVVAALTTLDSFASTRSALNEGNLAIGFIPTLIVYLVSGLILTLIRVLIASSALRKLFLKR